MAGTLITVSDAFRAALVAQGNTGTNAHKVVSMGVATAAFDATNKKLTKLPNELKRITTFGGQNIAADTIHVTLQDSTSDQYSLFGFGLYIEDGTLAAYYSQSTAIMEKSPAAQLLLSVDVQFASIDAATLSFPSASFLNPPATETVQGVIEIATQAETDAGTDDVRAVTPKKAAARYAPLKQPKLTGPVSVDGRLLIGTTTDDGTNAVQVVGTVRAANYVINSQGAADSGVFGFNNANGPSVKAYGSGTVGAGSLVLTTAGIERARINGAGRMLIGMTTDDGSSQAQINGPATGHGLMVRRNGQGTQYIGIGSGTGLDPNALTDNKIVSYSAAGAAKNLYIHATTDEAGTVPTNGSVGINFKILGGTPARIWQSGNFGLGNGISDDGTNQLQVAGSGNFTKGVTVTQSGGGFTANDPTGTLHSNLNFQSAGLQRWGVRGDWGNGRLQINRYTSAGAYQDGPFSIAWSSGTVSMPNRVTVGTTADDGANVLQVAGNSRTYGTNVSGGSGSVTAWVSSDSTYGYFRTAGSATVGSENPNGFCDLFAGNASRVRVLPSGRVLMGQTASDDGSTALQLYPGPTGYALTAMRNGSSSSQWLGIGAAPNANAAQVHNFIDSYSSANNAKLLILSSTTDANNTAPTSGQVGISFRTLGVERMAVDGSGNVRVGTSADDGVSRLTVGGIASFNAGYIKINRDVAEGQIWLGKNDGYLFGNATEMGWNSPTQGKWSYNYAARNLMVSTYPVWHTGTLPTPLDKSGGSMTGALLLAQGSAASPGLSFANSGAAGTGLYHISNGTFGVTNSGTNTVQFGAGGTTFVSSVWGKTAAAGDASTLLATTQFVSTAMLNAQVGQIVYEPRTSVRAGYLKLNGAVLKRTDYPALWAYAQASGAIVTDAQWSGGSWGCFSTGDGATTFRIPELRGEHIRCWDDGRGIDGSRAIGSWQDSQNRSHAHGASSAAVGDHAHSAWTDAQGTHSHGGGTGGVGDHQHVVPWGENTGSYAPPWGTYGGNTNVGAKDHDNDNTWALTSPAGNHSHGIGADGNHGHNVGVGAAGGHAHTITVNADGGTETRVRSVALLAMIRAY